MDKIDNKVKHIKLAKSVIENFDIDPRNYIELKGHPNFTLRNKNESNKIYVKDKNFSAKYNIDFFDANNTSLYLGEKISGNIHIKVHEEDSLIYIGDDCIFLKIIIDSNQKNDLIAIGEKVTANINNQWRSGLRSGNENPAIIVGDDCMFAADIVMRNTDAHPIYNLENEIQINVPKSLILIEPHVWVGQQVNILKDVKVGACSVVALGSIVTKDIDKFTIAKGIPAKGEINKQFYWSVSTTVKARLRAKYYMKKYL